MTYRPHIEQLEKQLEDERTMLDQFTLALNQLRSTKVDLRLQSQILPELPEDEQSNTLADWANQEQLLTTFRLLVEDRESMMVRSPAIAFQNSFRLPPLMSGSLCLLTQSIARL